MYLIIILYHVNIDGMLHDMFNNVDSTQLVAIDDIITNIFKCNIVNLLNFHRACV